MAKSKSSGRWLQEHFADPYVKKSREDGYRSRASYKLLELDQKDRLMRPGDLVIDLGAAPGGWSQVAVERVGHNGRVIASDLLQMDGLAGVDFIQGDFTDDLIFDEILNAVNGQPVNLVISDMAPNMSGMKAIDQPRGMYLAELALDLASRVLSKNGAFVTKLFMGEGADAYIREVRGSFERVVTRKPSSSRARSSELYMVAKGFKSA